MNEVEENVNKIKAVIFDIDGVLLDSFEANLKFFQNLMTKTGHKPPTREEFPSIFHLTLRNAIKALTGLDSEEEIEKIWQIGKNNRKLYDKSLLSMPKGADFVIRDLNKKYLLGIVTSRIKESVYEFPALARLEKYFKVAVSYQDTVNHKPHPEPLIFAAKKLGLKSEECVYIGDVENDIKAARSAGMKVIIYSKDKIPNADRLIDSFTEIPGLIEKL